MNKLMSGLFAAIVSWPVAISAQAQDLQLLASWDQSYSAVGEVLLPFMEHIEQETSADLNLTRFGPETIPPFEQLDPVARGLFDMLYTNGAYHANDIAVGMALDSLVGNTEQLREAGIWDLVDEQYQKMGLKLIAVLYDMNGYHIMLKEPLKGDGLAGRRIRGTPIYHPVIEALGGSPVVLPGPEIYPALERGVVDGAAWPTTGAVAYRWYEVADYMMRPSFGQVGHMVLMNLDTWNGLDEQTRTEIADAARAFETEANVLFDAIVEKEVETLAAEGMEVTELSEELLPKISEAWFAGVMELAAEKNPEAIEQLRKMARDADVDG